MRLLFRDTHTCEMAMEHCRIKIEKQSKCLSTASCLIIYGTVIMCYCTAVKRNAYVHTRQNSKCILSEF